ncbi:MAG TPA: BlaI/MecI/CopY family transcriptional regulator [Pirellulales bacterium]|nr:BlaI/MecI/CopY family transcriptional regulator [Pirellulales bacterium]
MARPAAKELTHRELEVLQAFWQNGELTASEARDQLAKRGLDLAYVTVANLVRIVEDKGFLIKTNQERPFTYRAARSFDDVSDSLVHDLVRRVFKGSREQLLLNVLKRRRLTAKERVLLREILDEESET